jgi:hypothetical protein
MTHYNPIRSHQTGKQLEPSPRRYAVTLTSLVANPRTAKGALKNATISVQQSTRSSAGAKSHLKKTQRRTVIILHFCPIWLTILITVSQLRVIHRGASLRHVYCN